MKRTMLTALSALALAVPAFADPQLYVSLNYVTSYDVAENDLGPISYESVIRNDDTVLTKVNLAGTTAVLHEFDVMLKVNGLGAGQDLVTVLYAPVMTAKVSMDGSVNGTYAAYDANNPTIDPVLMGGTTKSNAASASVFDTNQGEASNFFQAIRYGSTSTGNGNGTYGDYAAAVQLGEASAYKVGTLRLNALEEGQFEFSFLMNPGYFQVINNNTNGMGIGTDRTYPTYEGLTDTVQFVVPEPASMSLLALGGLALLRRARRA